MLYGVDLLYMLCRDQQVQQTYDYVETYQFAEVLSTERLVKVCHARKQIRVLRYT